MNMDEKLRNRGILKRLRQIRRDIHLWRDFRSDYKDYEKYNFGNLYQVSAEAYRGKILRQTHIVEKGLSLSHPRKGFGKDKIRRLTEYVDEYVKLGYDLNDICVQNAASVLQEYNEFQKELGCEWPELEEKIRNYDRWRTERYKGGIIPQTKSEIEQAAKKEFPDFFKSRHSVRQFSDEPVDLELVKEAVEVAMKAPSACNRQAPKVYYYVSEKKNRMLGEKIVGNTGFDEEVSKYLIITSDICAYTDSYERNQPYVDGALFGMSLVMSLHYYGFASCCIQACENSELKEIKKIGNIPDNEAVVMFLAIGNYKESFNVAVSERKNLDQTLIIDRNE